MSKRHHYETRQNGTQRHPTHSRSGVDDGSLPEVFEGEGTWHAFATALTECPECASNRETAVHDRENTVRRLHSQGGLEGDRNDEKRVETDTGTQSTMLDPGTVATFYAGVSTSADSLSIHVHFSTGHTVELIGPDETVHRSVDPGDSMKEAIGIRTWTVDSSEPGQWTVEIRSPLSGEKRKVSVTFGTLTAEQDT
ncbi:hypothetical protein [Halostella pelagica]|uniref:hypothetical protein n=1 Tax=Halostella pelagica TaxID=2583824 RepID=UPI00108074E5|nr:hypothetical protein [Halostella pelagica]